MNHKAMTKAQLIAYINKLEVDFVAEGRRAQQLREQLVLAKPISPVFAQPVAVHKAYYEYVRQCRTEQRERGMRVVTYKTFSDWSRSVAQ